MFSRHQPSKSASRGRGGSIFGRAVSVAVLLVLTVSSILIAPAQGGLVPSIPVVPVAETPVENVSQPEPAMPVADQESALVTVSDDQGDSRTLLAQLRTADPAVYAEIAAAQPEMMARLSKGIPLEELRTEAGFGAATGWPRADSMTSAAEMAAQASSMRVFNQLIAQFEAGPEDEEEGYPERDYRDFFPTCDLDGDGYKDIVSNDWGFNYPGYLSQLHAVSGQSGKTLWRFTNGDYIPFMLGPFYTDTGSYWGPRRPGLPLPQWPIAPPNNMALTSDLNGDGVCDVISWGGEMLYPVTPLTILVGFLWIEFNGTLQAVDGANGRALWTLPYNGVLRTVMCPPILQSCNTHEYEKYTFEGYPTGFLSYDSPSGPKFVWKTTDLTFDDTLNNEEWIVEEHIMLGDARSGKAYWVFDKPDISNSGPLVTWLTGAADVWDDPEPDIVIDDSDMSVSVLNGNPQVGVLDPVARIVWGPQGYFNPQPLTRPIDEQPPEIVCWYYVKIIGDVTNDGYADILPSYFTGPPQPPCRSPFNEAFHTHFSPLNGNNGRRLWTIDVKLQGWGYGTDLNPTTNITFRGWGWAPWGATMDKASNPYIAFGMLDVPTLRLSATRFPAKFSRLTVLDVADANGRWAYRERFGLDSYMSYELSLWQILLNLAPRDWTDDGVRDMASAARYMQPVGATQTLLANAQHEYKLVDSVNGKTIDEILMWGASGMLAPCEGDTTKQLTAVAGHAKRIDIIRYDVERDNRSWRRPIHNNPVPQSMTAGIEMLFLTGRCADDMETNRTMFGLNVGLFSLKRNFEIKPLHGAIGHNDTLQWVLPKLRGNPPVDPSLDFIVITPKEVPLTQKVAFNALPALPGFAAGIGLGFLRRRKKSAGGAL